MSGMARPTREDAPSSGVCLMSTMCRRMMGGGHGLGLLLLIPAGILLMLGATIILAPGILTWLVAGGLIAVGGLILAAAFHVRRPHSPAA